MFFREKDGKNVENIQDLKSRHTSPMNKTIATYSVVEAKDSDAGEYKCVLLDKDGNRAVEGSIKVVKANDVVAIKVPKNINVVEGEPLKIECLTKGHVTLEWTYRKYIAFVYFQIFLLHLNDFEKLIVLKTFALYTNRDN